MPIIMACIIFLSIYKPQHVFVFQKNTFLCYSTILLTLASRLQKQLLFQIKEILSCDLQKGIVSLLNLLYVDSL